MILQCCVNVGPPSTTLTRRWPNINTTLEDHCLWDQTLKMHQVNTRQTRTLSNCWCIVGPASTTLDQHWTNNSSMSRIFWVNTRQTGHDVMVYATQHSQNVSTLTSTHPSTFHLSLSRGMHGSGALFWRLLVPDCNQLPSQWRINVRLTVSANCDM